MKAAPYSSALAIIAAANLFALVVLNLLKLPANAVTMVWPLPVGAGFILLRGCRWRWPRFALPRAGWGMLVAWAALLMAPRLPYLLSFLLLRHGHDGEWHSAVAPWFGAGAGCHGERSGVPVLWAALGSSGSVFLAASGALACIPGRGAAGSNVAVLPAAGFVTTLLAIYGASDTGERRPPGAGASRPGPVS